MYLRYKADHSLIGMFAPWSRPINSRRPFMIAYRLKGVSGDGLSYVGYRNQAEAMNVWEICVKPLNRR